MSPENDALGFIFISQKLAFPFILPLMAKISGERKIPQVQPIAEITGVRDVSEFFYTSLLEISKKQGVLLPEEISFYLVNLLRAFHTETHFNLFPSEKPLCILLMESETLPREAERAQLKWLGDFTLFMVGFFSESFARKLVGASYYEQLGKAAYQRLSAVDLSGSIYTDLSRKFTTYTDLLYELSLSEKARLPAILHLYEEWLSRGSKLAHRLLLEAGITPQTREWHSLSTVQ